MTVLSTVKWSETLESVLYFYSGGKKRHLWSECSFNFNGGRVFLLKSFQKNILIKYFKKYIQISFGGYFIDYLNKPTHLKTSRSMDLADNSPNLITVWIIESVDRVQYIFEGHLIVKQEINKIRFILHRTGTNRSCKQCTCNLAEMKVCPLSTLHDS